jgi:hypothetical protein
MKSSNSDPPRCHLLAVPSGTKPGLGRLGIIVIAILTMLVLGLLVVAFVPQVGNASISLKVDKNP